MSPVEYQADIWAPTRFRFTRAEVVEVMRHLQSVFDAVRLVRPGSGVQWALDAEGRLRESEYRCWVVWRRDSRCVNCISRRVVAQQGRITKFEFLGDDLRHVTAKYVEVDGEPLSMEMISAIRDDTMLDGYGRRDVVEAISKHNQRMYIDPLTGAYNRRYLEEMFQGEHPDMAVAIIDVDHFKSINDGYGHSVGDRVLRDIVGGIFGCVRSTDAVIRYGGDEFVLIFDGMPDGMLPGKLEQIRRKIDELEFPEQPELKPTISIGGAFGSGKVDDLISRADRMLYAAKDAGRNSVRCG